MNKLEEMFEYKKQIKLFNEQVEMFTKAKKSYMDKLKQTLTEVKSRTYYFKNSSNKDLFTLFEIFNIEYVYIKNITTGELLKVKFDEIDTVVEI